MALTAEGESCQIIHHAPEDACLGHEGDHNRLDRMLQDVADLGRHTCVALN